MNSGQTGAVLKRKAREGADIDVIMREKRIGDLAWQMTMASQKLSACPREKRTAKERLEKLFNEAKREYDFLVCEIEMENAAEDYGVYLG